MDGKIFPVDPRAPDEKAIQRAALCINQGGLVVFPTSTFYGLAAHAMDEKAVKRVYQVKSRSTQKPLLILIHSLTQLPSLVQFIPDVAGPIIKSFWPGGVTLIFKAKGVLPQNLTAHTGKIGIRHVAHPVAMALVKQIESPITGTSANISGKAGVTKVHALDEEMMEQVDLVLDAGELGGGKGSTIVDVTGKSPEILREGTIAAERIFSVFD